MCRIRPNVCLLLSYLLLKLDGSCVFFKQTSTKTVNYVSTFLFLVDILYGMIKMKISLMRL